mgnify:CR=1 FL=1
MTEVRDLDPATDAGWRDAWLARHCGSPLQARRGELLDVRGLPGLIAEQDGDPVGLLCYREDGTQTRELVLLSAEPRWHGTGTALVRALIERVNKGCVWVVTTNDNTDALRFYQRCGFRLRALRPGAVDQARSTVKPESPATGAHGIPMRDELELELRL